MSLLVEQLRETGVHFYTPRLFALLRSREVAEAAIAELRCAGFPTDDVHTWSGEAGAALLDSDGADPGVAARMWRSAKGLIGVRQLIERTGVRFGTGVSASASGANRAATPGGRARCSRRTRLAP